MTGAGASANLMLRRTMSRARRSAFFHEGDYQAAHPDLSEVDLLAHYAEHGVWEGRSATTPERLTSRLSRAVMLTEIGAPDIGLLRLGYRQALTARPTIHLPEAALKDEERLADRVAAALATIGVRTSISAGASDHVAPLGIVIHPHRVFSTPPRQTPERIVDALVVTTATPGDEAFAADLPYMLAARGVVASQASTCALLVDAGAPTAFLPGLHFSEAVDAPPLSHPLFQGLTRDIRDAPTASGWDERPIDIVALEPATEARTNAWSRMALTLSKRRTIVYQPPPHALSEADEAAMRRFLYRRSKLVLHLHAAEPASLDARLIEEVAAAGAVLISEPSPPHPIVRPGVHYFEISARRMPALADDLLTAGDGRERAVAAIRVTRRTLARFDDLEVTGLAIARLFAVDEGEP